jgi:integrase
LKRIILIQFFKWLYDPDSPEPRNRKTPDIVAGIKQYKRKEESIYKPTDLWTEEDDLLFLKYCDSPRDRCYHTVARDTACRPSELLGVKISQIDFKTLGNGRQYASIVVNGKTGNREVVLTNSLPYLKDWLNVHPLKGNPDACLFLSQSDKNLNKQLTGIGLFHIYRRYKLERFPSLLQQDSDVSESDKQHIRQLLKKPFNPYLRRHIGLTQRAKQIHEYELRQYSGWSKNSKMHLRYIHWFNNQGSNAVLKAEGFVSDEGSEVEKLKPVYCSNCNEANIKNAKWCSKCGMVLSFSGYQEALKEQKYKDEKINVIEKQLEAQSNQLKALISALGNINDQSQVNQMAQTLYSSGILNVSSSSKYGSKK